MIKWLSKKVSPDELKEHGILIPDENVSKPENPAEPEEELKSEDPTFGYEGLPHTIRITAGRTQRNTEVNAIKSFAEFI